MKRLVLVLLAFAASAASGQVVIRERIQVDVGAPKVGGASIAAIDCSGPIVGYMVLRPGAVQLSSTAVTYTMGTPLDGTVTVETTCGSTSGDVASAYTLTGTSNYGWGDLVRYDYAPNSSAELVRVPLRRGEAALSSTYEIIGETVEFSYTLGHVSSIRDELGNARFGCWLFQCNEDSVGANVTTHRVYEGLASGLVAAWPPAAACGAHLPVEFRAVQPGGAEGYLHPDVAFSANVVQAGYPYVPDLGHLELGADQGTQLSALYGDLAFGQLEYAAPACPVAQQGDVRLTLGTGWFPQLSQTVTILAEQTELNLLVDSDNDGQLTNLDDAIELAPGRLGALVEFNDDDDDENDESDYIDVGGVEPDLEVIRIEGPVQDGATVRLDVVGESGTIAVWRDPLRETPAELPLTVSATVLPLSLWLEGVAWAENPVTLVATYEAGGGQMPLVAADSARVFSGTPSLGFWSDVAPAREWPGLVSGLPIGTPVEVVLRKNAWELQRIPLVVGQSTPFVANGLASVAGESYNVELWGDAAPNGALHLITSEAVQTVAGPPASVSLTVDGTHLAVANGKTTTTLLARVEDADGFPVKGAEVSLRSLQWIGPDPDAVPVASTVVTSWNGEARFYAVAPITDDVAHVADVGTIESEPLELPYHAPTLSLSASAPAFDVAAGGTALVTLTTDAPWGSEIYWQLSHPKPGQAAAFTSLVGSGGTFALSLPLNGVPLGDAYVSARIGEAWAYTTMRFESSAPLSLEFGQRLLAGDLAGPTQGVSPDGSVAQSYETYYEPFDEDGERLPETVYYQGNVRLFASTQITVRGSPNTTYEVGLDNPGDAALVALDGLLPTGRVQTDASGVATVWIRSKGALVETPGQIFRPIEITVRGLVPTALQGGTDPPSWTATIYLAPRGKLENTVDFIWGAIGGDPATAWGIAGAFAGGMVAIADLGSLVKNAYRGFTGGPVNRFEVVLSTAGLATELIVGGGEVPDAPISAVRAIVAFAGNTPFSRALVFVIKTGLRNGRDLKQLGKFSLKMAENAGFLFAGTKAFTSTATLEQAVRATDRFEHAYPTAIHELATSCLAAGWHQGALAEGAGAGPHAWGTSAVSPRGPPSVPAKANPGTGTVCGINARALHELTKVFGSAKIGDVPPPLATALEALEAANPNAATALTKRLFHATTVGRLPAAALRRTLQADVFAPSAGFFNSSRRLPTAYTVEDMIEDLGAVADKLEDSEAARHGMLALVDRIGATGHQYAFRYELEVAAYLARLPSSQVVRVTQRIPAGASSFSDIDVVVDGVAYQAKINTNAMRKGGLEQSVVAYAKRVYDAGFDELRYVSPPRDAQNNLGFTSNTITRVNGLNGDNRLPPGMTLMISSEANPSFLPIPFK